MTGIVDWVKNYSMVFLLMTIFTSVAAKKEYKKYIQLFVECILVIVLINPLLKVSGKSDDLFEKIAYDSFWQGLEGLKKDQAKMEFQKEEYYVNYYEKAIEEDVRLLAENSGYVITDVKVVLNEQYEVVSMEVYVAKDRVETIIIGKVNETPPSPEYEVLKKKIAAYYQVDRENIFIMD